MSSSPVQIKLSDRDLGQSKLALPSQSVKKLIFALKECSSSKNLTNGRNLHSAAARNGDDSNAFVASALINMYAKCGSIDEACRIFNNLENPDVVCWNALIMGYADNGQSEVALDFLWRMRREGYEADERTLVAALKACADLAARSGDLCKAAFRERGKALHMVARSCGCDSHHHLQNTLVDMYAKCGSMEDARGVFDGVQDPDVVCWNAYILGYADNGESEAAVDVFCRMGLEGYAPNARTFVAALKACADLGLKQDGSSKRSSRARGKKVHLLALRCGCELNIYVQNTLVDMYARCADMGNARIVFLTVKKPDVVCWNALILGYTDNGKSEVALELLSNIRREGLAPSPRTFVAALKACADLAAEEDGEEVNSKLVKTRSIAKGQKLHLLVLQNGFQSDCYVQVTLIDMYAKCGSMDEASAVFESTKHPNVVCWNALILGYADNGEGGIALDVFTRMKREGCRPDSRTFNASLQACGSIGALSIGRKIHAELCKSGLKDDAVLANALLDFYVKCGSLTEAEQVFDAHPSRDLVTWTTLMSAYSCLGDTETVLGILERMTEADLKPDNVTFKCILTACNHAGLADLGKDQFEAMSRKFGLKPEIEHYNSVIDMLGRANTLDEAMVMLRNMPFRPNAVTWTTVLGACRKRENVRLGRLLFEAAVFVDEGNSASYVLMANLYGSRGMWEEQAEIAAMRTSFEVPNSRTGRSWWTNEGVIHAF